MGDVICTYKLIPDSPENFDSVKSAVQSMEPQRIGEEPIAFGIIAVKATFLVPEESGKLEELETKLNSMEHVESVELDNMTRSL